MGDGEEDLMIEGLEEDGTPREEHTYTGLDADDEDTRNEILNGALVKTVISNAVRCVFTSTQFIIYCS